MKAWLRFPRVLWLAGIVVLAAIAPAIALSGRSPDTGATNAGEPLPTPGPSDQNTPAPEANAVTACPDATVTVSTAAELTNALSDVAPGTVIHLAEGTYQGEFTATGDGTPDEPITLCGSRNSVLDGGAIGGGYVLHVENASHWVIQGFTVQNGQKGVMLDGTSNSLIADLRVQDIGDEAIHLRAFSVDNQVLGNEISDTGLRKKKFGEGIYIGTAESNWCDISNCEPDRSDRNLISGNTIRGTTAESVDIKEGTSAGLLNDNTFDGSDIDEDGADSWVDVKGNGWTIERNTGVNSPLDGFQTHEILDGWGTNNVFRDNIAHVNGPGFGYSLTPVRGNVVDCTNQASQAGEGLSNETCTRN